MAVHSRCAIITKISGKPALSYNQLIPALGAEIRPIKESVHKPLEINYEVADALYQKAVYLVRPSDRNL